MSRVKPPEGQQCECNEPPYDHHDYFYRAEYEGDPGWGCDEGCNRSPWDHSWPNHGGELRRIYWRKDDHMCFGWWCANCRSWLPENEDDWEPWPTGDDGRFMSSVHCQRIPGLD